MKDQKFGKSLCLQFSIRHQSTPKWSRNFCEIITMCSISFFVLNDNFIELNVFRIDKIRVLETKILQILYIFSHCDKNKNNWGANFCDFCTLQKVLLVIGTIYRSLWSLATSDCFFILIPDIKRFSCNFFFVTSELEEKSLLSKKNFESFHSLKTTTFSIFVFFWKAWFWIKIFKTCQILN